MTNKKWLLLTAASLITGASHSQKSPRVEKALNDPMRAQNEAKADVYILSKQDVADSPDPGSQRIETKTTPNKKNPQSIFIKNPAGERDFL